MDKRKRKRQEEGPQSVVAYVTPHGSFMRKLEQDSLEEVHEVVRKKLGLGKTDALRLSWKYEEERMSLDDDDDFAGFVVYARGVPSIRIDVHAVSGSMPLATPSRMISTPASNLGNQSREDPGLSSSISVAAADTDKPAAKRRKTVSFPVPVSTPLSASALGSTPKAQATNIRPDPTPSKAPKTPRKSTKKTAEDTSTVEAEAPVATPTTHEPASAEAGPSDLTLVSKASKTPRKSKKATNASASDAIVAHRNATTNASTTSNSDVATAVAGPSQVLLSPKIAEAPKTPRASKKKKAANAETASAQLALARKVAAVPAAMPTTSVTSIEPEESISTAVASAKEKQKKAPASARAEAAAATVTKPAIPATVAPVDTPDPVTPVDTTSKKPKSTAKLSAKAKAKEATSASTAPAVTVAVTSSKDAGPAPGTESEPAPPQARKRGRPPKSAKTLAKAVETTGAANDAVALKTAQPQASTVATTVLPPTPAVTANAKDGKAKKRKRGQDTVSASAVVAAPVTTATTTTTIKGASPAELTSTLPAVSTPPVVLPDADADAGPSTVVDESTTSTSTAPKSSAKHKSKAATKAKAKASPILATPTTEATSEPCNYCGKLPWHSSVHCPVMSAGPNVIEARVLEMLGAGLDAESTCIKNMRYAVERGRKREQGEEMSPVKTVGARKKDDLAEKGAAKKAAKAKAKGGMEKGEGVKGNKAKAKKEPVEVESEDEEEDVLPQPPMKDAKGLTKAIDKDKRQATPATTKKTAGKESTSVKGNGLATPVSTEVPAQANGGKNISQGKTKDLAIPGDKPVGERQPKAKLDGKAKPVPVVVSDSSAEEEESDSEDDEPQQSVKPKNAVLARREQTAKAAAASKVEAVVTKGSKAASVEKVQSAKSRQKNAEVVEDSDDDDEEPEPPRKISKTSHKVQPPATTTNAVASKSTDPVPSSSHGKSKPSTESTTQKSRAVKKSALGVPSTSSAASSDSDSNSDSDSECDAGSDAGRKSKSKPSTSRPANAGQHSFRANEDDLLAQLQAPMKSSQAVLDLIADDNLFDGEKDGSESDDSSDKNDPGDHAVEDDSEEERERTSARVGTSARRGGPYRGASSSEEEEEEVDDSTSEKEDEEDEDDSSKSVSEAEVDEDLAEDQSSATPKQQAQVISDDEGEDDEKENDDEETNDVKQTDTAPQGADRMDVGEDEDNHMRGHEIVVGDTRKEPALVAFTHENNVEAEPTEITTPKPHHQVLEVDKPISDEDTQAIEDAEIEDDPEADDDKDEEAKVDKKFAAVPASPAHSEVSPPRHEIKNGHRPITDEEAQAIEDAEMEDDPEAGEEDDEHAKAASAAIADPGQAVVASGSGLQHGTHVALKPIGDEEARAIEDVEVEDNPQANDDDDEDAEATSVSTAVEGHSDNLEDTNGMKSFQEMGAESDARMRSSSVERETDIQNLLSEDAQPDVVSGAVPPAPEDAPALQTSAKRKSSPQFEQLAHSEDEVQPTPSIPLQAGVDPNDVEAIDPIEPAEDVPTMRPEAIDPIQEPSPTKPKASSQRSVASSEDVVPTQTQVSESPPPAKRQLGRPKRAAAVAGSAAMSVLLSQGSAYDPSQDVPPSTPTPAPISAPKEDSAFTQAKKPRGRPRISEEEKARREMEKIRMKEEKAAAKAAKSTKKPTLNRRRSVNLNSTSKPISSDSETENESQHNPQQSQVQWATLGRDSSSAPDDVLSSMTDQLETTPATGRRPPSESGSSQDATTMPPKTRRKISHTSAVSDNQDGQETPQQSYTGLFLPGTQTQARGQFVDEDYEISQSSQFVSNGLLDDPFRSKDPEDDDDGSQDTGKPSQNGKLKFNAAKTPSMIRVRPPRISMPSVSLTLSQMKNSPSVNFANLLPPPSAASTPAASQARPRSRRRQPLQEESDDDDEDGSSSGSGSDSDAPAKTTPHIPTSRRAGASLMKSKRKTGLKALGDLT